MLPAMTPDLPFIPEALRPYMPLIVGIVTALVIFVIGWIVAGFVHRLVLELARHRRIDQAVARFLASLAQWAVIAIAVITALARVGVQTTSLVALLGTAGLAIGLALQGNLAHFASGVMLLVFRPITIDDIEDTGIAASEFSDVVLFKTPVVSDSISVERSSLLVVTSELDGAVHARTYSHVSLAGSAREPSILRGALFASNSEVHVFQALTGG